MKHVVTEEDPLSETNQRTTNTLQYMVASETVMKNGIEPEQMMVKEELEYEDCDLVTKIEILHEMLPLTKPENLDLK